MEEEERSRLDVRCACVRLAPEVEGARASCAFLDVGRRREHVEEVLLSYDKRTCSASAAYDLINRTYNASVA